MDDKKAKLLALAAKRKADSDQIPSKGIHPKPTVGSASTKTGPSSEKLASKREEEMERQERLLSKTKNYDDYDEGDGFIAGSEEDEAEASDALDSASPDSDEEVKPKKKKIKAVIEKKVKKVKSSKKKKGSDDESDAGSEESAVDIAEELDFLDKSNIIQTGRRTRGKKIDYTQFGADKPEDDE